MSRGLPLDSGKYAVLCCKYVPGAVFRRYILSQLLSAAMVFHQYCTAVIHWHVYGSHIQAYLSDNLTCQKKYRRLL